MQVTKLLPQAISESQYDLQKKNAKTDFVVLNDITQLLHKQICSSVDSSYELSKTTLALLSLLV